jgi:GTP-sensing pleiotropic transcriptional regulator CodY
MTSPERQTLLGAGFESRLGYPISRQMFSSSDLPDKYWDNALNLATTTAFCTLSSQLFIAQSYDVAQTLAIY